MESSFAAVRDLLWREVRAAGEGLWDGAARFAAPVFDDNGGEPQHDLAASVLYGLYWLVSGLAERAPIALLVDDAQWLDAASARFLVYLARRLDSLPVLLAVVVRSGQMPGQVPGGSAGRVGGDRVSGRSVERRRQRGGGPPQARGARG